MLTTKPPTSNPPDLKTAMGEEGEQEYLQLVALLQEAQDMFALFPIVSDLPMGLRDAFLARLVQDLSPLPVRILCVRRENWDAAWTLAEAAQEAANHGVLVLVGLEDTPGMVPEFGRKHPRPPALAALNHGREDLRRRCPMPIVVWCPPFVYTAMREHAPDFFDHFTSLFRFQNRQKALRDPESRSDLLLWASGERSRGNTEATQIAIVFYEQQLANSREATPKRANLLLGLAESLWALPIGNRAENLKRALIATEEALSLLTPERYAYEWARAQVLMGLAYADLPSGDRDANLRAAIGCYEAALRVRTEQAFPQDYAFTIANLGLLEAQRGDLASAQRHWKEALRVLQAIGDAHSAQRVAAWLPALEQSQQS